MQKRSPMLAEGSPARFDGAPVEGRRVFAAFDARAITSNARALLLGATDRAITLIGRFAACCRDAGMPQRVAHEIATLVGQRVFGIALRHEDVVDQRPNATRPGASHLCRILSRASLAC